MARAVKGLIPTKKQPAGHRQLPEALLHSFELISNFGNVQKIYGEFY